MDRNKNTKIIEVENYGLLSDMSTTLVVLLDEELTENFDWWYNLTDEDDGDEYLWNEMSYRRYGKPTNRFYDTEPTEFDSYLAVEN